MTIKFENSFGEERIIGTSQTIVEAMKIVQDFLKEHSYKSYYTRCLLFEEERKILLDVGSHSEFFWIYLSEEECIDAKWKELS